MPSPATVHLVQGDHAGAILRQACQEYGLPGTVRVIPEDLSHGPLDDGPARIAYMRACYHGFADWTHVITDAFAPWRDLIAFLDRDRTAALITWAGNNVSEAIFLAMACSWLVGRHETLFRAAPPDPAISRYVSQHTPQEIAAAYHVRTHLSNTQRGALARSFTRIRDRCGPLRRWEHGRVIGVPLTHYDTLLLQSCGPEWRPASQIIGTAMAACDPANLLSDLFFSARLQALIAAGRLGTCNPKTDHPGSNIFRYMVRHSAI